MFRNPPDNDAVRINNSNSNYNEANYNGARGLRINNSNTNENNVGQIRSRVIDPNNLRRMRRMRMAFANAGLVGRRLNFGNNGNNRPNASNYMKNGKRMKKNVNENTKTKKIKWKKILQIAIKSLANSDGVVA